MRSNFPATLPVELTRDPWDIGLAERQRLAAEMADAQASWRQRLATLVEPPEPDAGFPAYLMEAPQYAELRSAIGSATQRRELDVATADQLQRFVDLFRGYLLGSAQP